MTLQSNYLPLETPNIRLWCGRENNVSSGHQALGTHSLPLEQAKMRLGLSRESDVSMARIYLDLIFGLLIILLVARHCDLIFCLLTNPNCG